MQLMCNGLKENITKRRINGVKCNVIFLCDINTKEQQLDLRRDGMGVWTCGHKRVKEPFLGTKRSKRVCDTYVWRSTWTCKAEPSLKRIEIYRRARNEDGSVGELLSPMLIQYCFQGAIKQVNVQPHGNSQGKLPFHPSDRSLLREIKERATTSGLPPLKLYTAVSINY